MRIRSLALFAICAMSVVAMAEEGTPLAEARKTFRTTLTEKVALKAPLAKPPADVFRLVRYKAAPGALAAYVSPDPGDGRKHPAIIWITGGDCNSIDDVWSAGPPENDQTAAAYRKAGIIMMFPSLRGGSGNPGFKEGFYGELDDVLAAADYLAAQPYVDASRIYLGGHSTGGTLALLVAEYSNRFRGIFSFGPVTDVALYGRDVIALPFDRRNPLERDLRSPRRWLQGVPVPTFVFEGEQPPGNSPDVEEMAKSAGESKVKFFLVQNKDHFSILAPANAMIAEKIKQDNGTASNLSFKAEDMPGLKPITPATRPSATPGGNGSPDQPVIAGQATGNRNMYGFGQDRMVGLTYRLTPIGRIACVSGFGAKHPFKPREGEQLVQAREGYAVCGLVVDADDAVNALRVVFVRIQDGRPVPADSYMSDWFGKPQTKTPITLGSTQQRVNNMVMYDSGDPWYRQLNGIALVCVPGR